MRKRKMGCGYDLHTTGGSPGNLLDCYPARTASLPVRWSNYSASSAEFVGRFRFGEPPQFVIKGNFHGFVGAKAVGSSGHHSDFVVEAFHSAIGDFAFGPKPIQDQW